MKGPNELFRSEGFESLDVTLKHSWLDSPWHEAGLVFDSALRAGGGLYKWTYLGLNLEIMAEGPLPVPGLSAATQRIWRKSIHVPKDANVEII